MHEERDLEQNGLLGVEDLGRLGLGLGLGSRGGGDALRGLGLGPLERRVAAVVVLETPVSAELRPEVVVTVPALPVANTATALVPMAPDASTLTVPMPNVPAAPVSEVCPTPVTLKNSRVSVSPSTPAG